MIFDFKTKDPILMLFCDQIPKKEERGYDDSQLHLEACSAAAPLGERSLQLLILRPWTILTLSRLTIQKNINEKGLS
jgi:hypothetical protein